MNKALTLAFFISLQYSAEGYRGKIKRVLNGPEDNQLLDSEEGAPNSQRDGSDLTSSSTQPRSQGRTYYYWLTGEAEKMTSAQETANKSAVTETSVDSGRSTIGSAKTSKGVASNGSVGSGTVAPTRNIDLVVTNLSYQQPFGDFFIMVHDDLAQPLFSLGEAASSELGQLAETGKTHGLVEVYGNSSGILLAGTIVGPLVGGESLYFTIQISKDYPLVTMASKVLNTNDGYVVVMFIVKYSLRVYVLTAEAKLTVLSP